MQIYRHGTRPARTRRSEDPGKGGPQLKIAVENGKLYVYPEGRIGAGAHGAVYRLDGETILKVVKDMTLDAIHSEVKVSKDVLIYGIPTAISYDVVRTEGGYGEDLGGMFRFEKRMN